MNANEEQNCMLRRENTASVENVVNVTFLDDLAVEGRMEMDLDVLMNNPPFLRATVKMDQQPSWVNKDYREVMGKHIALNDKLQRQYVRKIDELVAKLSAVRKRIDAFMSAFPTKEAFEASDVYQNFDALCAEHKIYLGIDADDFAIAYYVKN